MSAGKYAVTPNPGCHDPGQRFAVTCNGQCIGHAPTRYKARQLAGDHAEQARRKARDAHQRNARV